MPDLKIPFVEVKDGKLSVDLKTVKETHSFGILMDILTLPDYNLVDAHYTASALESIIKTPQDDFKYKVTIEPIHEKKEVR